MAGGGLAGGCTVGTTDALGLDAGEDQFPVHDLHAASLPMFRIDHPQLVSANKERPGWIGEGALIFVDSIVESRDGGSPRACRQMTAA